MGILVGIIFGLIGVEWFTDIIMFCIDYLLCFSYTSTIIKISGRSYVKWLFLKILISLYFSVCFSSHFIPFHLLFKFSLEIIRRVRSFNFFYSSRHLSWIIWASFKVISFDFMYLLRSLFLMKIDFCIPRIFHGLFLNFSFCLESLFRGTYICKI